MALTKNRVSIVGEIVGHFEYSYKVFGEKFYTNHVKVGRLSTASDIVPITVSDRMVDVKADWIGSYVRIGGQFRSYNKKEEERKRLILSVFVEEFEVIDGLRNDNIIELEGYICKTPIYRKTPLDREIADILIAANRPYGKTDYIPCISWGRNARYASTLPIGTKVSVMGRIQSRAYYKYISDGQYETRIAYEVSASRIVEMESGSDE